MKFKPKKSLGQNFLSDQNIINSIISTANINKESIVLEIGPGTGNLTKSILKKNPKKLIVVEKDKELSNFLYEKFNNKISVINKDILNIKLNSENNENIIVFGNLPYNISTEILVNWIKDKDKFKCSKKLILMFQKEVADRILAKTNSKAYGRLTVFSNWKYEIKKEFDISPNCFFPKPKIFSTLLTFTPKKKIFRIKNPENLEKISRIFFNQRRKMIKNPLKQIFKNPKIVIDKLELNQNLRPQNLNPLTYFKITEEFENLIN